jgi:hypothetical protein
MKIKIQNMMRNLVSGMVTDVLWIASQEQSNKVATIQGGSTLPNIDVSDEKFVAFDQLTEQIVIDWVLAELGEDGTNNLQQQLDQIFANQNLQTNVAGLPW